MNYVINSVLAPVKVYVLETVQDRR